MMTSLQRKMWRELWHMRSQALAIMLVIVGGVGVCIMSLSCYDSLLTTRDSYYRDYAFADVFASVKRAPDALVARIEEISGVASIEARVVAQVNLMVPGFDDPVSGLLTSIGDEADTRINRLYLLSGRYPDARRDDEVLISDAFAEAQKLAAGDRISAVINGRYRQLRIVGVALSPEYIYQIAPGAVFPDYQRFGVLWMPDRALSAAFDMQGAFNDLVLKLQPGASQAAVIDELDLLLARYGGQGAYGRDDQFSNLFLKEEFAQLKTMAYLFPAIFLSVAVFLLNVVISRLIAAQREVIAVMKAFGYSHFQVAWHYTSMVLIITIIGILAGYLLGMYLGQLMTGTYTQYYRFPLLMYTPQASMFIGVAFFTIAAAVLGSSRSVLQAANLPPAEAMRPEPPAHFKQSLVERLGLGRLLSPPSKMIIRHLQLKPLKTAMVLMGLAMSSAIMMVGNFQQDAVTFMMHAQFNVAQKQDLDITLYEPVSSAALSSLRVLPGVEYVEGQRVVPVRLKYQQRSYRTAIQGLSPDSHLQSVLDLDLNAIEIPQQGLMVTEHLADKLGFKVGDTIEIELLEGHRFSRQVTVTHLSQQYMGLGAYMSLESLNRLMREGPAINKVLLSIEPEYASEIYRRLRDMPAVAGVTLRQTVIDSFYNTLDQILLVFTFINAILGGVIAFGVVYNSVRITLAERGRELASLRVLGYSQGEVAYILLGELALLTLISLPFGFLIGTGLCEFMAENMKSDLYRIPLVLSTYTYAFSGLIVILSALFSGLLVLRRLNQLDLVEVLKTRE